MVNTNTLRSFGLGSMAGLLLLLSSCSLDGLAQNILLETVDDSSGGTSSEVCGLTVSPPPIAIPDDTANAKSTHLTVRNAAADHPLLTPNGDGYHDETLFNADFEIVNPGVAGRSYILDWTVDVTDLTTCAAATRSLNSVPVSFPQTSIAYDEDFEGLPAGTIVTNQYQGFTVECDNRKRWRPDACILLDSQSNDCEGNFCSTNQGKVLVLAKNVRDRDQDGIVDHPDDASRGGTMVLNFDTPVTLSSLTFQDVDEYESCDAVVTDVNGVETWYDIPRGPNKALTTLTTNASNVVSVELTLRGSVSVTHVAFTKEVEDEGNALLNVRDTWAGTDAGGATLPDGAYGFAITGTLRDDSGNVIDTLSSKTLGMRIDTSVVDFEQQPPVTTCDPDADETACQCPPEDPHCSVQYLETLPSHSDILLLAPGFITTTMDANTGRYAVIADVTTALNGGLVRQGDGIWASGAALQGYIAELTGVPADPDGRIFNFDYTQIGNTTRVDDLGPTPLSFNSLILDLITDENGGITIDGTWINLGASLNSTESGTPAYDVIDTYTGSECSYVSSFNGGDTLSSKFCVENDGIELPDGVGLYTIRSAVFDTLQNEAPTTTRETFCTSDGCAIRTHYTPVDITIDSFYFSIGELGAELVFNDQTSYSAPALSRVFDRGPVTAVISGQCSRAIVENSDLRVRLDAADGAVDTTCIINGYYD